MTHVGRELRKLGIASHKDAGCFQESLGSGCSTVGIWRLQRGAYSSLHFAKR